MCSFENYSFSRPSWISRIAKPICFISISYLKNEDRLTIMSTEAISMVIGHHSSRAKLKCRVDIAFDRVCQRSNSTFETHFGRIINAWIKQPSEYAVILPSTSLLLYHYENTLPHARFVYFGQNCAVYLNAEPKIQKFNRKIRARWTPLSASSLFRLSR